MSIVSNNIRYLRKLNGYTQEQFAQRIGIKRSLLGAYEEARANPNQVNLDNMSREFGIPAEVILKDDLREQALQRQDGMIMKLNPDARPVTPDYLPPSQDQPSASPATSAPQQMDLFHADGVPSNPATAAKTNTPTLPQKLSLKELIAAALRNEADGLYKFFESGHDFPVPGALLIGARTKDLYELKDQNHYILLTRTHGSCYRRVYNRMAVKRTVILSSDFRHIPTLEIPAEEVLEAWEILACISTELPSAGTETERLKELVKEMGHLLNTGPINSRG